MFGFFKRNKNKKKEANVKNKNAPKKPAGKVVKLTTGILASTSFLSIGDKPSINVPIPPKKYAGKFLKKENNIIILLVSAPKAERFGYKENSTVGISFVENIAGSSQAMNVFTAKISMIEKVEELEKFNNLGIEREKEFTDSAAKADCDLYILEITPVTDTIQLQQRQYFRVDVSFPIYHKPQNETNVRQKKKNKYERYNDRVRSNFKLKMINVSGGGFKCKTDTYVEPNTILDCKIIVHYEVLPVFARILETISETTETGESVYFVRAAFHEMDEFIRDKLLKYIFMHQVRMQKNVHRK